MALKEYKSKRNFKTTSEPKGQIKRTKGKLKFVVQEHRARALHYDFRLEHDGVLISFAVPKGLSENPNDKRLAVKVEDHPLDYINFEGIIPKGNYGAGTVKIFDRGQYNPLIPMDKALKKGHIKIELFGKKFKGQWSLIKIDEKNWLIKKADDEFASNKTKKKKLPLKNVSVQLATLTDAIPKGKDWLFEIKYDGYRIIAFKENGKVKLLTRNGENYTKKLKNIEKSLKNLKEDNFVIDGEVVSFDSNGRSDFGLLQSNLKTGNNLFYVVFDCLCLNSEDIRMESLITRKEKLKLVIHGADKNIIYSDSIKGKGEDCFKFALKNGLEGIVAKKANSKYSGERNEDWLKIKCYKRQEFVIVGYETSEKNPLLSALLLGYYSNKELKYVGKTGTGFNENVKKELVKKFKTLKTQRKLFNINSKNVTFLKPKLVAEIQFAEITKDGLLRQASFIGLRDDKDATDVKLERANENF